MWRSDLKSTLLRGRVLGVAVSLLLLSALFWAGCSSDLTSINEPVGVDNEAARNETISPRLRSVFEIQNRHSADLMLSENVVATATSIDENGNPYIKIYTIEAASKGALPFELDGIPVVHEISGRIVAMKGKPGGGGGTDPKAKQTPPVKMGTSGGWRHDLANGYCCGGTLGSLVQIGGSKYVLSNYHVLEADIVNGGNGRVATTGDPVIQPALIDVGCVASSAQDVATLVVKNALPGNNVDCAVAQIISGMVDTSGAILDIGTISSSTVAASVGQAVKKMGRTTGLTRSTVDGLNASVSVSYEDECAGSTAFTKTYSGQIIIKNKRSGFLAGGDSGSLMVEDVSTDPRAVGLLFAGSNTLAVANPIDDVLGFLNASMVGN
jgi:hypothetical protein